jgi:hypothetical protein
LSLENSRPIELYVWIVLLDETDRILIQGGAADSYTRRRSEPVQDAGPGFSAAPAAGAVRMHDKRVLVPAFVAAEPQMWQGYFLFCPRAVFRTGAFDRDEDDLRADGFARRAGAAARDGAVPRAGFGAGARRGSATGAERCTMVKRV